METDIDQMLEQSSRTVTYGSSGKSTMSSGMGRFSKASFVASTEDGDGQDVYLDDPEFWEKSVQLEAPHESTSEDLMKVLFEKRSRKQVNFYAPYAVFLGISRAWYIVVVRWDCFELYYQIIFNFYLYF